jgi:phytanoyl-CoA dioxygenase PhyH
VTDNDDRDGAIALAALQKLQNKINPALRDEIAAYLARTIGEAAPPFELPMPSEALRTRLRDEGCAPIGRLLDEAQCGQIEDYFRERPCFNTHVPVYSDQVPRNFADARHAGHYGSYRWSDIARAPHLVETALRPDLLALAHDYLGCLPTIYSIHAWWTFADKPTPAQTHRIHRDLDDFRFLAVFIYLTDVGPEDGPTQMIRRTHRKDLSDEYVQKYNAGLAAEGADAAATVSPTLLFPPESGNARRLTLDFARLFPGLEEEFTGPAGTAAIADTFGLHHGTMPKTRDRLVCWIRYGLYRNEIYRNDKNVPLPWSTLGRTLVRTPAHDYMMRLLFA